ncbi:MAG: right-handed parallel beta-helix repeat-containing protein [Opitutales bacterium]|nr:right-handed parallel beta-helix repeat-containing protein [Opitutales bacterium]
MSTLKVALLLLTLVAASPLWAGEAFFVSPEGDDNWSGRYEIALEDGSDGPFASFERAQEAVRGVLAQAGTHREVRVWVRGGVYERRQTLRLGGEDSGIGPALVHWQAYPGERVVWSGGQTVRGFQRLSDTDIESRVPGTNRERIYVVDLKAAGVEDYGELRRLGFHIPYTPSALQLYYREEPMTLARYPNEGWELIAAVPQDGERRIHPGNPVDKRDGKVPTGRHYGAIEYHGDRPASWASHEDIWLHGYWTWDWADSTQQVASIDTETRRIELAEPHHNYGYTSGQRFYFYNVPEELDAAGEWYLDRERGLLFFWPPDGDAFSAEVSVSILADPMIVVEDAAHIRLQGFEFAYARGPAIVIRNSEAIEVVGGSFHNLGGRPVTIEGGSQCRVVDGVFTKLDTGAIDVSGGDRSSLEPAGHAIVNNHIHRFGLTFRTYHPAIRINGVGQRVAHNLIHNAPHMAISFQGNDHRIEYNEIFDIARETGDVGAIYTGRDYTSRGTIVRYNFLHDLHGPGLHGVRAVYLDDFASGIQIYGNVFHRAGRAAFVGGGRDNVISNNVFIDCEPSVQIDGRGLSWANHHLDEDHPNYVPTLRNFMRDARVDQPPYAERYPELQKLFTDEPKVPKGNIVANNISYDGIFLDLFDGVDFDTVEVRDNYIGDPIALRITEDTDQDPDFEIHHSANPDTRIPANTVAAKPSRPYAIIDGKIQANPEAFPKGIGFVPIPIHKIGLQQEK